MATDTVVDVVMPQMGVSVSEGTITKWLKQEGQPVEADEPLLEISTDKVDTEVPSPGAGILQQILVQEGETVEVGTRLAVLGSGAAAAEPEAAPVESAEPPPSTEELPIPATAKAASEAADLGGAEGGLPPGLVGADTGGPEPEPAALTGGDTNGRTFVSPVVARIASEHGVDLARISGTGRGGRVTKKDIMGFIDSGAAEEPASVSAPVVPAAPQLQPAPAPMQAAAPVVNPGPAAAAAPPPTQPAPSQPVAEAPAPLAAGPGEAFEPMNAMRRGIADHMRRSLDTSAHVTTVFEVDMTKVVGIRQRLKASYAEGYGVSLTYLAFIGRATVEALRNWPWMNGEIRGDKIVTKQFVNLGIAVALEGGKGLIVPIVKNAEEKNLLGLARAIADVAERARTKRLTPDDVQGGSFTITNPGGWGAIMGTPIISQPQVGILDVEALVKRPVVITDELGNDQIAIRSMMNLCLAYDHRLVDGAYAAQFMKELRESLESWDETTY